MDGVIILCTLLGITAEVSRRMWRAFGNGDVDSATPRPFAKTRVEIWLERQDWEKLLGFRYDWQPAPVVTRVTQRIAPPVAPISSTPPIPVSPPAQPEPHEENDLIGRLEAELTRATTERFIDTLFTDFEQPVAKIEPPETEELIQLKDVIILARFATIDETVGLPVGAPDVFEFTIARTPTKPIDSVDFRAGESEAEYRIAASLRKEPEDFAVASHEQQADETETPDPLAEVIAEILEEEPPAEDPNALELPLLPLSRSYQPDPVHAGEPIGAPAVNEVTTTPHQIVSQLADTSSIVQHPLTPMPQETANATSGASHQPLPLGAGEPIGAPGIHEIGIISRPVASPVETEQPIATIIPFTPQANVPVKPLIRSYQPDFIHAGEPIGGPGVQEIGIISRPTASPVTTEQPIATIVPFTPAADDLIESAIRFYQPDHVHPGEPVGDPSLHLDVLPTAPLIPLRKPDSDYQIAASARQESEEYAIAAYSIQPDAGRGPSRNPSTGEETEPADEVTEEDAIIAELLKEEEPVADPNALELPLIIPDDPALAKLRAGQPIGDPGVFEFSIPPQAPADAQKDSQGEPEPSAAIDTEINRISEKVENILSNALARPAPAINFQDALADMTAKAKERKKAKEEAEANRLPSRAVEDNLSNSADRSGGLKMTEYKVQFEVFEGPLDLLLYLVRKQEVDIYEVNLTQIAEEFIKYIDLMRELDLEVAGEFLVMSASLMYIKSKELLPVEQQSVSEEDEEEEDPRWELIRQLVEYKKFKDAAADFKTLELAQEDVFPRNPPKPDFPVEKIKANVSVFDLIGAVNKVLARLDAKETREIFADRWTVSEKIELIRNQVLEQDKVMFSQLFEDVLSRTEVVATFLAILELIKLKVIVVEQPDTFSDIEICKSPPGHKLDLESERETELPIAGDTAEPASEFDAPPADEE